MEIRTSRDVAQVVRTTRLQRSLSQQQLARAAGVSRRWLIDVEAGKPGASVELVLHLLVTLGLPLTAGGAPAHHEPPRAGELDLDEHLRRYDPPRAP